MFIISSLIVVGIIISLIELPRLINDRLWKEIFVFYILLITGVALGIYMAI